MDYGRVYESICERGKLRLTEEYTEKHHIIPRCMGGSDVKSNITVLTAREHFIAHWLLHRMHPLDKGLAHAFWMMSNIYNTHRKYTPSSRAYKEAKEAHIKNISGENNHNKKQVNKDKISKTLKKIGHKPPSPKGKTRSEQHKKNLSNSLKGKKHSPERVKRNSEVHLGLQVGDKNGMYKRVDKHEFIEDIKSGLTIKQMYVKYNLKQTAFYNRLYEYFGTYKLRQVRKNSYL